MRGGEGALGMAPRVEGVPFEGVYFNRASCVLSPVAGGLIAGPDGASIGKFGWSDAQGVVRNLRTDARDVLGLVVVQFGDWGRAFWDDVTCTWRVRAGFGLTMLNRAPGITVRFNDNADGAFQRVYADPVDGSLHAAYAAELEPTPWATTAPAGAGGLTLITTWNPTL